MGNDGGTIVRRLDIVRVRESTGEGSKSVDPAVLARIRASTCALSNQPLRTPIVSDRLGGLFNKDNVVKLLLQRAEKGSNGPAATAKGSAAAKLAHIRSMKDVKQLHLTKNPAARATDEERHRTRDENVPCPFVCPLTQREMNGRHRFVYLWPCGCVMSESGLRATVRSDAAGGKAAPPNATADPSPAAEGCPVCGLTFSPECLDKRDILPGGDVVLIDGKEDEVERMRAAMEEARRKELEQKKKAREGKKRKSERDSGATSSKADKSDHQQKRPKTSSDTKVKDLADVGVAQITA